MHTNEPREDPLVDLGYEIRDVNYKAVRGAVVGFLIFAVLCALVGVVCYRYRFAVFALKEPEKKEFARNIPGDPNPLLQDNVNSKVDLMTMRQAERAKLDSTGYADDAHSTAHIPIQKAMELLAVPSPTPEPEPVVEKAPAKVEPTPEPTPVQPPKKHSLTEFNAPENSSGAMPGTAPAGGAPAGEAHAPSNPAEGGTPAHP